MSAAKRALVDFVATLIRDIPADADAPLLIVEGGNEVSDPASRNEGIRYGY